MFTSEILSIIVVGGVMMTTIGFYLISRRQMAVEKGRSPVAECSAAVVERSHRWLLGGNIPLSRVVVYDDMVVIRGVNARVIHYGGMEIVKADTTLRSSDLTIRLLTDNTLLHVWCSDRGRIANAILERVRDHASATARP